MMVAAIQFVAHTKLLNIHHHTTGQRGWTKTLWYDLDEEYTHSISFDHTYYLLCKLKINYVNNCIEQHKSQFQLVKSSTFMLAHSD